MSKVTGNLEDKNNCWLWQGGKSEGYCKISKNVYGHRLMYKTFVGEIPQRFTLDHLCRVRHCINYNHLEPVTRGENVRRGEAGKHEKIKTHCPEGHEYTISNTMFITTRPGCKARRCRICNNERSNREYNKRKQFMGRYAE